MKNIFNSQNQDYVPDEEEIYFNERMQGKTEERNKALFLFLSIGVPVLIILLLGLALKTLFF
jgi:hypothetical protein